MKVSKIIRVFTVAPVMALVMLLVIEFSSPAIFGNKINLIMSILFLTVFPLLAYPLQPFIKRFKDKGREGQRTLAMIFAVAGYILGLLSAIILHAPHGVLVIYLGYLLSGILVVVCNKLFDFRASGHACGVAGPFAILLFFGQQSGFWGIPVLAAAWWASIKMKRHTISQLIGGTVIPILALGLVALMNKI
jgi:uncharacterized membrane protein YhaH (DUF805 family)